MKPLKAQSLPGRAALAIALAVVIVIIGYSIHVSLPFLEGPILSLDNPRENPTGTVTISGETERVSFLEINGYKTALNENGGFEVERAFPTGYTAVTVSAKDRFGRTITKTLTFVTNTHGDKKED